MVASGTLGMIADLPHGLVTASVTALLMPQQTTAYVSRLGVSQTF